MTVSQIMHTDGSAETRYYLLYYDWLPYLVLVWGLRRIEFDGALFNPACHPSSVTKVE